MSLLVPDVGEAAMLTLITAGNLTLKLYSNNKTPAASDTASDYTVVSGGGYANITLTSGNWGISGGSPGAALYNAYQDFQFTGTTTAPSTIYGYYVVNGSGTLMWAERFPADDVPFTPVNGSLISIKPRITLAG